MTDERPGRRPRRWTADALGLACVLAAVGVVLAPALAHGPYLGSFDILSRYGLTRHPGTLLHNGQTTDQVTEMIPWTMLAWTQVHAGHLPLWNSSNGLGMPLLANWQSAVFGLPALVGYLFPLRLAYDVQVVTTFVVSGTGAYVFGRVCRLHPVGATGAAVVFELCGPMLGFSGWPIAGVMAWTGWLFAAAVLVVRRRGRAGPVVLFAVVLAAAILGGQPRSLAVLLAALLVFLVVWLGMRALRSEYRSRVLGPVLGLAAGGVAGAGLAAPVLLPGTQLLGMSQFHVVERADRAFPPQDVAHVLMSGFSGQPLSQLHAFNVGTNTYIGVTAVALAVLGLVARFREPRAVALSAVAIVMAALLYFPPALAAVDTLPYRPRWHVAAVAMDFAVAVLAGMGLDHLWRSRPARSTVTALWVSFAAAAFVLLELWLFGRGHLPRAGARLREASFLWPAVQVATGAVVVVALRHVRTRSSGAGEDGPERSPWVRRAGCLVLLAGEAGFLLAAGAGVWSSGDTFFPGSASVTSLQRAVGSSLVGFAGRSCQVPPTLGIVAEANIGYGVREFAAYDPLTPRSYYTSWKQTTGTPAGYGLPLSVFCPVVTSAAEARLYGIGFLLGPAGGGTPTGTVPVESIGGEALYRVPGAAAATLVPDSDAGVAPASSAGGAPVALVARGPSSFRLATAAGTPGLLRVRIAEVPGWRASIDGRPLHLSRFAGLMLQARIPPGRHVVDLTYAPGTFDVGVVLAALSLGGCAAGLVVAVLRRRTRRHPGPIGGSRH